MCEDSCKNDDCLSSLIMWVQKMTTISLVETFFPHMKFGVRQRNVHTAEQISISWAVSIYLVFLWQKLSWFDRGFRQQFDKADTRLRE